MTNAVENKKLMQDLFAAAAAGNRGPLNDALADNLTMRITGQYSWSQTFYGKASYLNDLHGYLGTLLKEGRRTIPHRFIADDDHVVMQARGDMTTKAGVPYRNDYCLVYRLEKGKIVEITEYCDSVMTESILGPFPHARRETSKSLSAPPAAVADGGIG